MPITAKLSKKFYDRFGDDIAGELVDWFNSVDTTYRTDLRELNERNFERFDGRLEQRLAQMAGMLHTEIGETRVSLIKWMFVFWTGMTVTNVGIMFALARLVG